MSGVCQKCLGPIPNGDARWMFTPPEFPGVRLDKCQTCGKWSEAEQNLATTRLRQMMQRQQVIPNKSGGCNCTGKR